MFGTLMHIPLIIIQMTVALHCTVHPMSSRVCQALINSIILHTYWILVGRPIAPQSNKWHLLPVRSAQQSESHLTGADADRLQPALHRQAPTLCGCQQTLVKLVGHAGNHQA